jgi:hypothetical protein
MPIDHNKIFLANSCHHGYDLFMIKISLVGAVILFLIGCSQMITPMIVPTRTLTPSIGVNLTLTVHPEIVQETPAMNEVPIPTPLDPNLEKIVTQAKNDLANQLAIDPGQINLLEVASVTWPDGSLGCPQPDMVYTQVQVDGIRIRFQAGEQIYEYHGGGGRTPFLCK